MNDIIGNTFRVYSSIKGIIDDLQLRKQGVVAQIGLSGMQKAQKKYLKKRWRIKQRYAAGAVDRAEVRHMFMEAQLELLCNFSGVIVRSLDRIEMSNTNRGIE